MCIRVDANGWHYGISVYVHLMRGEYDSELVWPFRGYITIQLVNHNNDQNHCKLTVDFNDTAAAGERVISRERAVVGQVISQLITHNVMESSTETRQCIVNDCLTFRVIKVVVHSV